MKLVKVAQGVPEEALFHAIPEAVYAGDPEYVPPAAESEGAALWREEYDGGRQAVFVVVRDRVGVCRGVARPGPGEGTGVIGLFEALDDPDACRLLLDAAEQWLSGRGCRRVLGPMDGDTWHRYRFVTGPREVKSFLKEPWNPPYYPRLWEACGYEIADRYLSARIGEPARAARHLAPFVKRVRRAGYTFRPLRLDTFEDELAVLHGLSLRIFADNPHYSPISRGDFLQLYDGVRALTVPEFCQFCCCPDGTEAGFVFCFPDYADAVRAMKGRRNARAKLAFLLRRHQADRLCIKTLGCLPEFRGKGIGAALMGLAFEWAAASGFQEALMCLMHENNASNRLDGGCSVCFREYALYGKELGP